MNNTYLGAIRDKDGRRRYYFAPWDMNQCFNNKPDEIALQDADFLEIGDSGGARRNAELWGAYSDIGGAGLERWISSSVYHCIELYQDRWPKEPKSFEKAAFTACTARWIVIELQIQAPKKKRRPQRSE